MADALARKGALDGLAAWPKGTRHTLEPVGPRPVFVFRGPETAAANVGTALGVNFGQPLNQAQVAGTRATLRVGPDEWLILGLGDEGPAIAATVAASAGEAHSLVDVSHRNVGMVFAGSRVEAALNTGCPLDLSLAAFPVGMATRTLLGKVEIVLWRQAADRFHIECWRSFAPYVHALLGEAVLEYAA
jgi:sarcosine oxidase subunit gamma